MASWLVVGFIILVALALRWDFDNETKKLAGRLQNIEASLERVSDKLLIIGADTARAAQALDRRQETIEEQWLQEEHGQ